MSQQSLASQKQNKRAVGIRIDPDIDSEIIEYARETERSYTQILMKALRLGWPLFKKKNRGA